MELSYWSVRTAPTTAGHRSNTRNQRLIGQTDAALAAAAAQVSAGQDSGRPWLYRSGQRRTVVLPVRAAAHRGSTGVCWPGQRQTVVLPVSAGQGSGRPWFYRSGQRHTVVLPVSAGQDSGILTWLRRVHLAQMLGIKGQHRWRQAQPTDGDWDHLLMRWNHPDVEPYRQCPCTMNNMISNGSR